MMINLICIDFSHKFYRFSGNETQRKRKKQKSELNLDTDRVSCSYVVIVDSGELSENKRAAKKTQQQKKINFYRNLIHRIGTVAIIVILHALDETSFPLDEIETKKNIELKRKLNAFLRCFAYFFCVCGGVHH